MVAAAAGPAVRGWERNESRASSSPALSLALPPFNRHPGFPSAADTLVQLATSRPTSGSSRPLARSPVAAPKPTAWPGSLDSRRPRLSPTFHRPILLRPTLSSVVHAPKVPTSCCSVARRCSRSLGHSPAPVVLPGAPPQPHPARVGALPAPRTSPPPYQLLSPTSAARESRSCHLPGQGDRERRLLSQ